MIIEITAAEGATAKVEVEGGRITRADKIISFMVGWTGEQFAECCAEKQWTYAVVDTKVGKWDVWQNEWETAGMPEYHPVAKPPKLIVSFDSEEARTEFLQMMGSPTIHQKNRGTQSCWYPDRPMRDLKSIEFIDGFAG